MKKITVIILFFMACSSHKKSSPNEIIGTPKKINNIEVAENEFPKLMTWNEAVEACAGLGNGWRLPTDEELGDMFRSKNELGDFSNSDGYWSSSEHENEVTHKIEVWCRFFWDGHGLARDKTEKDLARPVRSL